jgi:hypothetical protein
MNGEWLSASGKPVCNQAAVVVGKWMQWNKGLPYGHFLYLCQEHSEYFEPLEFEPEIRRPWFQLIGRVTQQHATTMNKERTYV